MEKCNGGRTFIVLIISFMISKPIRLILYIAIVYICAMNDKDLSFWTVDVMHVRVSVVGEQPRG